MHMVPVFSPCGRRARLPPSILEQRTWRRGKPMSTTRDGGRGGGVESASQSSRYSHQVHRKGSKIPPSIRIYIYIYICLARKCPRP